MQRLLHVILSLAFLFVACNKEESSVTPTPAPETTPQTTLMYMTGTDLLNKGYYTTNVSMAKEAIAKNALGYGRFLVFMHYRDDSTMASLVEYKYSKGECVSEVLKEYTDITSLSYDAITEVIADTKEFAPADSYNLIISGHGTGWVPQTNPSTAWKVASESQQESQGSETINWDAMSTSPITTRYMGSSGDGFFDIADIHDSLEASDTHFGCIIFDACFMSSIEALYDLRNRCDYIIASPCEIMGAGFPYDTVLPQLFAESGCNPNLQGVCQAFYDYYSTYIYSSGCIALTVTSELEALADIIQQINSLEVVNPVEIESLQAYERLNNHIFVDLEQYILNKCSSYFLALDFLSQMERTFPTECRMHTEQFFANIGPTVSSANDYQAYYTTLEYFSGVSTSEPSIQVDSEWAVSAWAKAIEGLNE